jgi:hypothetical protein
MEANAMQSPDVDKTRLFQSGTEYWKAHYDFNKHLMTIDIALLAAFGALLGGIFRSPHPFDDIVSKVFSLIVFSGLFLSTVYATFATMACRANIQEMLFVKGLSDLEHLEDRYRKRSSRAVTTFGMSMFASLWFIYHAIMS